MYTTLTPLESWLSENSVIDSVSQGGQWQHSRCSKKSSALLAGLKEEQKKAVLKAKAAALQKNEKLELSKLKLKMEERELAMSEAKTKVIDECEKSLNVSNVPPSVKGFPVKPIPAV